MGTSSRINLSLAYCFSIVCILALSFTQVNAQICDTLEIDAGIDQYVCCGDQVQLQAASHHTWIMWTPSAGMNNPFVFNPIVTPQTTTTYYATVMDADGCMGTDSVTVFVSCPQLIGSLDFLSTCTGDDVPVTISMSEDIASYMITGTGSYHSDNIGGGTLSFEAVLNGAVSNFTVVLTGVSGCEVVEEFKLMATSMPVAECVMDQLVCHESEAEIRFTGSASPAAILTWDVDDGTIVYSSPATIDAPAGAVIRVVWPTPGNRFITLTVNDGGCIDSESKSVYVEKTPIVELDPDTCICAGDCIQLNSTTANGVIVQYFWMPETGLSDPSIPNPIACVDEDTEYVLCVMSSNGCMACDTIFVDVKDDFTDAGPDVDICPGTSTQLMASGAVSYSWTPATGLSCTDCPNPVANPTVTTTYTVTGINDMGCEATDDVTVTVLPPAMADAGPDVDICPGDDAQLMASGGVTYSWSPTTGLSDPNIANPIASPNVTTEYCVTVVDANGCEDTDCVTVSIIDLFTIELELEPATCGNFNGSATATILNGVGPYAYVWESNPSTTNMATGYAPGTYTVTVTDLGTGCSVSETFTIEDCQGPDDLTLLATPADCDAFNGTIMVMISGGKPPYMICWDGPAFGMVMDYPDNMYQITGLPPGDYKVKVMDVNECMIMETITVLMGPGDMVSTADPVNPDCSGNGGQITLDVSGYFQSYSVEVNGVLIEAGITTDTYVLDNLNVGSYNIRIFDIHGCQTSHFIKLEAPNGVDLDPSDVAVGDVSCDGSSDGSISSTTGTEYEVCNSGGTVIGMTPLNNLAAGNYTIKHTDNGCTATLNVTIGMPSGLDIQVSTTSPTCCDDDGSIQLAVTGGTGNYTYAWSPMVSTSNTASDLSADTYNVTITDGSGCAQTMTIDLVQDCDCVDFIPDDMVTLEFPDCDNILAEYCAPIPFANIGNYTIWLNGSAYTGTPSSCNGGAGTQFTFTQAGMYNLSFITVGTCCEDQILVNVTCMPCDDFITETNVDVSTCDVAADVCVSIPFAQASNYTIFVDGVQYTGAIVDCAGNLGIILMIGTHDVMFVDANGCMDGVIATVSSGGSLQLTDVNIRNVSCDDGTDGWIRSNTGTEYQVCDSDGNLIGMTPQENLPTGSYTVKYDDNGCTSSIQVMIEGPDPIDVQITTVPANCCDMNGSISLTVTGGNGNYTFDWSPDVSSDATANGLPSGPYTITVTDEKGCVEVVTVDLARDCDCDDFLPTPDLAIDYVGNCDDVEFDICLDIPFIEIGNYNITISGTPYTGQLDPCNGGAGTQLYLVGPGSHVILLFDPVACCEDGMTVDIACDGGDPCDDFIALDDKFYAFGSCDNVYASVCIEIPFAEAADYTVTNNGNPFLGTLAGCNNAMGTAFVITEPGLHNMVFTHDATGCQDSILIEIECVSPLIIYDTIFVNTIDNICLDVSELQGTQYTVENACEQMSGVHVTLLPIDGSVCFTCEGVSVGSEEACLVVKDEFGISDTTYFYITVIDEHALPVAQDDRDTTLQNTPKVVDIMVNDLQPDNNSYTEVTIQPMYGTAVANADGSITYTPNDDYCDESKPDYFAYNICNNLGCDQGAVFMTVLCDGIVIFNGFSPNQDGVNDYFKVQGIENYPNATLSVYNRWGTRVLEVQGYQNDWLGTFNGEDLPDGTYFYILEGIESQDYRGYLQIRR